MRVIGVAHTCVHHSGIPRIQTEVRMMTRWVLCLRVVSWDWGCTVPSKWSPYHTHNLKPRHINFYSSHIHSNYHAPCLRIHSLLHHAYRTEPSQADRVLIPPVSLRIFRTDTNESVEQGMENVERILEADVWCLMRDGDGDRDLRLGVEF